MPSICINQVKNFNGKSVTIQGWLYRHRSSGKIIFLIVRDGTGLLQGIVLKDSVSTSIFQRVTELTQESSIEITGIIQKVPQGQKAPGGYEMEVTNLKTIQHVDPKNPFPISPKEHGIEFLLDHRHLWLRSSRQHAILRIRHQIIRSIRSFFDKKDFTLIDTPIFTPAACEGTTNLFEVDYFDEKAYLTQSGQLYNEAAAAAFGKVYSFGPTFRAEKSKTRRHLTEFWMVEPEVAYATLDDILILAEDLIVNIINHVTQYCRPELEILQRNIASLEGIRTPFPKITYEEAIITLQSLGSKVVWGQDLGGTDETILAQQFNQPLIVHRYPIETKAFYMEPDPINPKLALCVDVLAPEGCGEIIGGGQRTTNLELLCQRIEKHQLPIENFQWYLDLRRYGTFSHSGFGMGLERVVAWVCGIEHVREAIPFPRTIYRMKP